MDSSTRHPSNLLKALGPGLLFAGAAIGVSHLVQSTRAGAIYGLGLIGVILLANLTKYPGLSFGSRYSNATGLSLLESYRKQGVWTLVIFGLLTLGTMFTVAGAVTLVTAGIFNEVVLVPLTGFGNLKVSAALLFGVVALCLATGGFSWLDKLIKVLLGTMAVLTFTTTLLVLPQLDFSSFSLLLPAKATEVAAIGFVVGLAGWMPAPMDISVWNSLWALAKRNQTGHTPTPRETRFDFNLGYFLCVVLALCFVILGTVVMHQNQITPDPKSITFVGQILNLFTVTLGSWSYPLVGTAALAVMFSTTLTVLDAFPRVLVVLFDRFRTAEVPGDAVRDFSKELQFWIAYGILVAGAFALLQFFILQLTALVDLATTLSFVTTPFLAWFNHRAIHSTDVSEAYRPSKAMSVFSLSCVAVLSVFAGFYIWSRFFWQ